MMKKQVIVLSLVNSILLASVQAGPSQMVKEKSDSNAGDFCKTLEEFGNIYKDKDNPYIQEVSVFGRIHAQYAYVDGSDVDGNDFNYDFEEIRRFRAGLKIKFLNDFQIKGSVNLEDDRKPQGQSRKFGYEDFDKFTLSYKMSDVLGLDKLSITYGRHIIRVGQEAHTSSREIKTVERAAITGKVYGGRYTGVSLTGTRGEVEGTLGFYSLDDSDFIGNWDAGNAIYMSTEFEAFGGDLILDLFYNLDQGSTDDEIGVGYEWAASAGWSGEIYDWDLAVNFIVGDNGADSKGEREGAFYGFIVMPSKDIIKDKLEFVTRYQFQGSTENQGIRLGSRYIRRSEQGGTDLDGGRGKAHHSLYTGLNYFLCDQQCKLMAGVEYETLDAVEGDADATTLWMAFRTYF